MYAENAYFSFHTISENSISVFLRTKYDIIWQYMDNGYHTIPLNIPS